MINTEKFNDYLADYKKNLPIRLENQKLKWEAVKFFQVNWNATSPDFGEMFRAATLPAKPLVESSNYGPRSLVRDVAEFDLVSVRELFDELFDENKEVGSRIDGFLAGFKKVYDRYVRETKPEGIDKSKRKQDIRAVSTYLWLMFPDKYYSYMYSVVSKATELLGSDIRVKSDGKPDNVTKAYAFYNEINALLLRDPELKTLLKKQLTDDCYPDKQLKTLTIDFVNFIGGGPEKGGDPKTDDGEKIEAVNTVEGEQGNDESVVAFDKYDETDFLREVFVSEHDFRRMQSILTDKKNLILQGPPGVGKTFAAMRLAYATIGAKKAERVKFVQFHQNYTYEDFVMGYKPDGEGFKLTNGVFYDFCQKAEADPDNKYFFIIDEINRGNISKIFGELLMLIESGYRGQRATLAYNKEEFCVPVNVYIIGMMNTADRSIAMLDYALRRRFGFVEMVPGFETDGFKAYAKALNNPKLDRLIKVVKELNAKIAEDDALGEGFEIGHSYFCDLNDTSDEKLLAIVENDIVPMLKEYWFDDKKTWTQWQDTLIGALRD